MLNFEYQNPTRIIFGRDTHKQVGERLKPLAKKVLLHYGGGSIKKNGIYSDIVASLKAAGVEYCELGGVVANPRLSLVRQGVELCREQKVDFILAVGGGSVIDSAKAIGLGVPYAGDVWDFFSGKETPRASLPIACVLTIPAAGSESSANAVVTDEVSGRKWATYCELSLPVFSIINPEFYASLPPHQIANGVCDMLCHIMERYFTETPHTELIDGLCEAAMKTIIRNGPRLLKDPGNYDIWSEIALAGTIAHNGWLGLGRQQEWAAHRIEHELSAQYDVAHGAGLAVVFPAWMKYLCDKHTGIFTQFAVNVMGVGGSLREFSFIENILASDHRPVTALLALK